MEDDSHEGGIIFLELVIGHNCSAHGQNLEFMDDISSPRMKIVMSFDKITIFVNLVFFRHFETITNIRTWIKSHIYWRML